MAKVKPLYKSKHDVYDDIGRETFLKIARDEEKITCTNELGVEIPFCKDNLEWISIKEEEFHRNVAKALIKSIRKSFDPNYIEEIPVKLTDQAIGCTNDKCRCKARKKEKEGLKDEST